MTRESIIELDNCLVEESDAFEERACRTLFDYWKGLSDADSAGLARVKDLNLMDLHTVAANLVVKQIENGGEEFRNRFWGSRVVDSFGIDATNKGIADYYQGAEREQILSLYRAAMAAPRPLRVTGRSSFMVKHSYHRFESAYVPFYDDDDQPSRLVVAFDFMLSV